MEAPSNSTFMIRVLCLDSCLFLPLFPIALLLAFHMRHSMMAAAMPVMFHPNGAGMILDSFLWERPAQPNPILWAVQCQWQLCREYLVYPNPCPIPAPLAALPISSLSTPLSGAMLLPCVCLVEGGRSTFLHFGESLIRWLCPSSSGMLAWFVSCSWPAEPAVQPPHSQLTLFCAQKAREEGHRLLRRRR